MVTPTYPEILEYILALGRRTIQNRIQNTMQLAEIMGSPQNSFKVIHVTGTCGKGSVSTQCANILYHAGYKIGLLTSPHILDYRERFQVNFHYITESYLLDTVLRIRNLAEENQIELSFSIMNSILAFCYFRDEAVDYAVIEVGAGGTTDTTNIVNPIVSVITSVGLDHCHMFGNTIESIAIEKSGVIKLGKPCVIGPNTPQELLRKIALEKGASVIEVGSRENENFINENQRITREVMKHIANDIDPLVIDTYVHAKPPLRLQSLTHNNSHFILDAGHNALALSRLLEATKQLYPDQKLNLIIGIATTKEIRLHVEEVIKHIDSVYLCTWEHAMLVGEEALETAKNEINSERIKGVFQLGTLLDQILQENKQETYIICGSFYLLEGTVMEMGRRGIPVPLIWGLYN